MWSNKSGERYEWCTLKQTDTENACGRGRGQQSASNIVPPGGPTRTAQNKAKSPAETWSLMIPADIVMKIVGYTNTKITQLHKNHRQPIGRNRQENTIQTNIIGRNESMVWSTVSSSCVEAKHDRY